MEKKAEYLSIVRGPVISAIRRFVSPLFMVMLLASFIFWFVAKLSHDYTTELEVKMRIEDQRFYVTCVVEGLGTNLLGYHMNRGGVMKLSLADLKHRVVKGQDADRYIRIDESSLSNMISVRYSDIKLVSIESLPDVLISEEIQEALDAAATMKKVSKR